MAYRKDNFNALKAINSDIEQQTFRHVYLLYGEEDYLRLQFRDRLKTAIAGDDDMNCTLFSGSSTKIEDVMSSAETLPFFADRRLILFDECGFFSHPPKQLLDLISHCPDYLYLIFLEKEVNEKTKLFQTISKAGIAAPMNTPSEDSLRKWAQQQFQAAGKSIEPGALSLLLEMTGSTMGLLKNEIDKLTAYTGDSPVVRHTDVEAVSSNVADNTVFTMVDAIGKRNQKRALALYREMLMENVSAAYILNRMEIQFQGILCVMEGRKKGLTAEKLASQLKAAPFQIRKYTEQSRNFSHEKAEAILNSCVEMDEKIKTGLIKDNIAVELLIIQAVQQ